MASTTKNRVYGRRKGKQLSRRQKENVETNLSKYSIFKLHGRSLFELQKIDLISLFGHLGEFELEIGFGMGDFLFQKAFIIIIVKKC